MDFYSFGCFRHYLPEDQPKVFSELLKRFIDNEWRLDDLPVTLEDQ